MKQRDIDWQLYPTNSNSAHIEVAWTGEFGIGPELQCPLCKDIISQAHVSVKCLHRFCKSCIEHCIQLSSDPFVICPVCFIPFHRDIDIKRDPRFDRLIELWHVSPAVHAERNGFVQPTRLQRDVRPRLDTRRLLTVEERSDGPTSGNRDIDTKHSISFRGGSRKRHRLNVPSETNKIPKGLVSHGTSLKVILKPRGGQTPSMDLSFNLQKDTSINTLREVVDDLVRAHMAATTETDEYQKGRVDFYVCHDSDDTIEIVKDYSNRIGHLQKSIPRLEDADKLVE